jgi:ribose transport system substrate-binding protein
MGSLRKYCATAGLAAVVAMSVAACGSDDSSSTSSSTDAAASTTAAADTTASTTASDSGSAGVEAAKQAVAEASAVPKFVAPGPAFDAKPAAGKTIALIPDYSSLPFVQEINVGLKAAAEKAGLKVNDCPNNGTVGDWVKCFNQAIAAKPDAIVLNGSPSPSQLQPQIAAAKKAGIPVIANHVPLDTEFPAGSLPKTNTTGLTGIEAGPFPKASKLMADFAVANQDSDHVNALIITANEAPASVGMVKMIQDELSKVDPESKNTVVNVPITDWATKLQDQTRTALLKDPNINWVIPVYDGAYQFVVPGIQAAGKLGKVKSVSFNGQKPALEAIAKGQVTGTIGENLAWTGWSTVDRVLRILATGQALEEKTADTPVRVWDKENISEAGNPPDPTKGYGDTYQDDYLKLWGLAG